MEYVALIDMGAIFIVPVMSILVSRFILNIRKTAPPDKDNTELTTYTSAGYSDPSGDVFTTRVDIYDARTTITNPREFVVHEPNMHEDEIQRVDATPEIA
ncbi:hypothetical protein DAEQUDRAFT_763581 [Daedalea quercina L-15889]|uniref:Uncharacterized protein n=1 Tax=Daedalea quercina L-15889 TaxID=1314783 RepID=A0A165SAQ1_9APHY|nr:hypothetical protein DAEQUDRAFT_763581 [Daedalea quercina L-15889]